MPHFTQSISIDLVRALPLVAAWTEIISAVVDHRPQYRLQLLAAAFVKMRLLAAGARDPVLVRFWHARQSLHGHCPGVVHRVPHQ
jgi:hypothetical protein